MELKNLQSAFRRAKTNHPVKTTAGMCVTGGSAFTSLLLLAPIDGGLSFFVGTVFTGAGTLIASLTAHVETAAPHKGTITHNNEIYHTNGRQEQKYDKLQRKIDELRSLYNSTANPKLRDKYQKRVQRLVDYQDDILDSKNVTRATVAANLPKMEIAYRNRTPGN